jgi:glycosyltransferase involved in cell wall biosynthesis
MSTKPSVSVVIAVFNRKGLMRKTLEGLVRQDYGNFEVIVADGDSTDGTKEMLFMYARKFKKIKPIIVKEPGRIIARNKAIAKSRGEIIIFMDSDCIAHENWISNMVKPFSDKDVGIVYGRTKANIKGAFWYHMENNGTEFIGHNTAMRAAVVKRLKGFDMEFKTAREDTDLAWRVLEQGYRAEFCGDARIMHISRRFHVTDRIKNQKQYVFDALLKKRHQALYKKYFIRFIFPASIENALLGALFVPFTAYFIAFYPIIGTALVLIYIAAVFYKLRNSGGTISEKTAFLGLIWILPFSRLYYYIRGFLKFGFWCKNAN